MHRWCVLAILTCSAAADSALRAEPKLIQPVPLQDVTLKADSRYERAVALNRDYILGIDSDRLLKTYRCPLQSYHTANVNIMLTDIHLSIQHSNHVIGRLGATSLPPTSRAPSKGLGGWEAPTVEIRGQFMGHWLSGTAMLGKNTGDKAVLDKAAEVVHELRAVQVALGGGYLSAFPTEHFERLRNLQQVWAPFYVIHKVMAGLLDQYTFLGNKLALQMVLDEAHFFQQYIHDIVEKEGLVHWIQMLEVEYGGMEEVLFNLFRVTGDTQWEKMATYFTKPNFFDPLTSNVDTLPGRHANTHLAQVNGFAAGYVGTGDEDRRSATANFFDIITGAHSYATGGSNDGEYWGAPYQLGASIAGEGGGRNTEETCTTYNMMKIARYLFQWTGNARYADYYERAILNGMLGVQRMPKDYTAYRTTASSKVTQSRKMLEATDKMPAEMFEQLWAETNHSELPAMQSLTPGLLNSPVLSVPNRSISHDWRRWAFAAIDDVRDLPEDSNQPGPGVIIYLMPLGAGNSRDDSWHHWSTPLNSFWCCSGSIVESFGKLMDSIYFESFSDAIPELYINQLTPSALHWRAGHLQLTLDAQPFSTDNRLRATIQLDPLSKSNEKPQEAKLNLRVPNWAVPEASSVTLQRRGSLETIAENVNPGTYITIQKRFHSGDKLLVEFGMRITVEKINDWHSEFNNLKAIIMGNYLLAAITEHDQDIQADSDRIAEYLHEVSDQDLVSLATDDGRVLQYSSGRVKLVREEKCWAAMMCTFHIRRSSSTKLAPGGDSGEEAGQAVSFESMALPGQHLSKTDAGLLALDISHSSDAQLWQVTNANQAQGHAATNFKTQLIHHQDLKLESEDGIIASSDFTLSIVQPLGSYPEGAKLLKGDDKSYVVAPIGHIIEEKYSPYLVFN